MTLMPRKLKYRVGDLFQVPVPSGFAYGLVARADGTGGVLGYFFLSPVPIPGADLSDYTPDRAQLVKQFGDYALQVKPQWPIIGHMHGASEWPVPEFKHENIVGEYWVLRSYNDNLEMIGQRKVSKEEAQRHPQDGLAGYRYLQEKLADMAAELVSGHPAQPAA